MRQSRLKISVLFFSFLVAFVLFSVQIAFAASKSSCPEEILDKGPIEGIYAGS